MHIYYLSRPFDKIYQTNGFTTMYIRVSQIYFKHMNYAKYFVLLPTDSTDLNIRVRSICEFTSF